MFIDTNGEVWYDSNEAAKDLNLGNSLVYRRAKEGFLETTKIITQDTMGRTRELVMFSKKSVEDYKKRHKKYVVHRYDKKSVEDLEIDRISHELLDGCWNWMCDHMDDILINGIEVSMRVPNNKDLGVFHGISKPCIDSKLEEIMKEREEYYENGRD